MDEQSHPLLHTFVRSLLFITVVVLAISLALFIALLVSSQLHANAQGNKPNPLNRNTSESPNLVTSGLATVGNKFSTAVWSIGKTTGDGTKTVADSGTSIAGSAYNGLAAVGRGIGSCAAKTGRTVASSVVFGVQAPFKVMSVATNPSNLAGIIQPTDHTEVPMIEDTSPDLAAAKAALPAMPTATPASQPAAATSVTLASSVAPQWPLHGTVTTEFGVYHRPYQNVHTGMDISDGKRTTIYPFRPGKVIDVVRGYGGGYGNHVVVDHGSGVTSVYAHLSSISVQVGQDVLQTTPIGNEGTTGLSTGNHLHFEVRVNGQAANPRHFITGNP